MAHMALAKTIPDIPFVYETRKRQFVRIFHFPGAVRKKERRQRWVWCFMKSSNLLFRMPNIKENGLRLNGENSTKKWTPPIGIHIYICSKFIVIENVWSAAMLVFQENPAGFKLFCYVNNIFCLSKFSRPLTTWVNCTLQWLQWSW